MNVIIGITIKRNGYTQTLAGHNIYQVIKGGTFEEGIQTRGTLRAFRATYPKENFVIGDEVVDFETGDIVAYNGKTDYVH